MAERLELPIDTQHLGLYLISDCVALDTFGLLFGGFMNSIKKLALTAAMLISSSSFAGWGAIAYNPYTGYAATSSQQWSLQDATYWALYSCGPGCQIVTYGLNSCMAFATGFYGAWGQSNSQPTAWHATNAALAYCGNPSCSVRAVTCF